MTALKLGEFVSQCVNQFSKWFEPFSEGLDSIITLLTPETRDKATMSNSHCTTNIPNNSSFVY